MNIPDSHSPDIRECLMHVKLVFVGSARTTPSPILYVAFQLTENSNIRTKVNVGMKHISLKKEAV